MSQSPPSPPCSWSQNGWSILDRFPDVVSADNLVQGAGFVAGLHAPPSPSFLTISRGVLPDHDNPRSNAFLHSVDESGRYLVVSAIQGSGAERVLVCHAGSRKASALPEVPAALKVKLSARDCIGVIDDPRGDSAYIVAQFCPAPATASITAVSTTRATEAGVPTASASTVGVVTALAPAASDMSLRELASSPCVHTQSPAPSLSCERFKLLCFLSRDETWSLNDITLSSPRHDLSKFHVDTVVSFDSRLCFVDLSIGMVICDPLLDGFDARLVMLPLAETSVAPEYNPRSTIGRRRGMAVSQGRLRFVLIEGDGHDAVLRMWSLHDANAGDNWIVDVAVPIREILDHRTYQQAGLSHGELPSFGVLNPNDADIMYLISGSYVFSVELATRQTIDHCLFFVDVGPEGTVHSSLEMCNWILPPPCNPRIGTSAGRTRLDILKQKGKSWGKTACKTIMNNKSLINSIPIAANFAECFVPTPILPFTRAVGQVAIRACEGLHIGETWGRRLADTANCRGNGGFDIRIVQTKEEANRVIRDWEERGRPNDLYIQFAPFMKKEEEADLRVYVSTNGAEPLLQYIDGWPGDYEVLGRTNES